MNGVLSQLEVYAKPFLQVFHLSVVEMLIGSQPLPLILGIQFIHVTIVHEFLV